jgi:hypothetical protein
MAAAAAAGRVLSYGELFKDGEYRMEGETAAGDDATMAEADDDSFAQEGAGPQRLHASTPHIPRATARPGMSADQCFS